MRWLSSLVVMVTLVCCGDDDGMVMDDAGMPDADFDANVEPEIPMPDLWGPSTAPDVNDADDVVEIQLTATLGIVELGDDVRYAGMRYQEQVPGPILHARVGDELVVHFTNDLDEETTIHWHGLRISDQMDGNPRIQEPVQPGETFTYRFELPEAGTYWYHPHVRSNEQVEKGLYGALVVHDADDPEYDLERVLVLDDIVLESGSEMLPPFLATHPEIMHGRYGNTLLTNGQLSELVAGEATKGQVERWRIVNVANARTMELSVTGCALARDRRRRRQAVDAVRNRPTDRAGGTAVRRRDLVRRRRHHGADQPRPHAQRGRDRGGRGGHSSLRDQRRRLGGNAAHD